MNISGHTKLTGLIGRPVSHSISPAMHNEAFEQLDLDYRYLAFDIKPDDIEDAIKGLKAIGILGFNITMPYKSIVSTLVDELTPVSRITGACNTVINQNGRFIGHTTDGIGFMKAAEDAGYQIIGQKMTLLGAGGAATAICAQAALDGVTEIDIFEQPTEPYFSKAKAFAERIRQHTD